MDRGSLITLSIIAGVAAVAAGVVLWKRMNKASATVDPEVVEGQSKTTAPATNSSASAAKPKAKDSTSKPVDTALPKKPTFSWEAVR